MITQDPLGYNTTVKFNKIDKSFIKEHKVSIVKSYIAPTKNAKVTVSTIKDFLNFFDSPHNTILVDTINLKT